MTTRNPNDPTVSRTVSDRDADEASEFEFRATDVSVARVLVRVRELVPDASASAVRLLESILCTLLAWRRGKRFAPREYGRMTRSLAYTLTELHKRSDEEDTAQSFLKEWFNHLMCRCLGDAFVPPRPPQALFKGWVARLVLRRLARRDASFFYSLLQSKRYWPELGPKKKKAALDDAWGRLIDPPNRVIGDDTLVEIQEVSEEIFGEIKPSTKLAPSPSACYQATVRENGAYSLFRPMEPPAQFEEAILGSLRAYSAAFERWRRMVMEVAVQRSAEALDSYSKCSVQIIPEPSKFRIISKGDGYVYTRCQPVQGAMLSAWRRSRFSTMIGDVDAKVRALARGNHFPLWCSGDFKAATDTLDWRTTAAALLPVMRETQFMWLFDAMNTPVWLEFPDNRAGWQKGGQLMGHPLSFPLLCVINLALYRLALRRYCGPLGTKHPLYRRYRNRVLVNGDDILFKCDLGLYKIWKRTVEEVGLIVSPGKNYVCENYAVINSRLYYAPWESRYATPVESKFRRLGYINLKLIKGFSLKTGESRATPDQIGKDVSDMVRLCPQALGWVPACFRRFSMPWVANWYLPVSLGGYGLDPCLAPDEVYVSRRQRQMAAIFVADRRLRLFRKLGDGARSLLSHHSWFLNTRVADPDEEVQESAWVVRLSQWDYAMNGPRPVKDYVPSRLRIARRVKPMSDAGLLRHWSDRLVLVDAPVCPELTVVAA